jgi:FtsP/CotA-like multicopper oxidase with cupredoxin domain
MPHPIHLHGMFFDLVIPGAEKSGRLPRKHTVIVKPADKVSVDITAEHVGDWAFHCHLLYHMAAGMMQVVSILPADHSAMGHGKMDHTKMDHSSMKHEDMQR